MQQHRILVDVMISLVVGVISHLVLTDLPCGPPKGDSADTISLYYWPLIAAMHFKKHHHQITNHL